MLLNLRIYRLLGVYCVHLMVIGSTLSLLACTDSRRLDYALEFAGNNRGEPKACRSSFFDREYAAVLFQIF